MMMHIVLQRAMLVQFSCLQFIRRMGRRVMVERFIIQISIITILTLLRCLLLQRSKSLFYRVYQNISFFHLIFIMDQMRIMSLRNAQLLLCCILVIAKHLPSEQKVRLNSLKVIRSVLWFVQKLILRKMVSQENKVNSILMVA